MAVTTFAAIDIGSYEISMKIFEFSKKIGFRELNDVRYRLEIGKGAYSRGRLEPEMVDDICVILKDFSNMMQEFGAATVRTYEKSDNLCYQDIYKISITEVLRRNNRIFEWRTLWKNRKLN